MDPQSDEDTIRKLLQRMKAEDQQQLTSFDDLVLREARVVGARSSRRWVIAAYGTAATLVLGFVLIFGDGSDSNRSPGGGLARESAVQVTHPPDLDFAALQGAIDQYFVSVPVPEWKPDALQKRLQSKLTRIQQEVQRRAEAGQPPMEAMQLIQTFPEQMQAGKHKEAEAILDRVLKMLDLVSKPVPPPEKRSSRQRPTTSAVLAQVKELERKDVAWRNIPWKTCLIEGLAASREQNKPVMLWIFIDRPVDDERC